jgi:hypothetical protein
LNEGVQWRITLPDLDIEHGAPICPDLFFVQFGLVHQDFPDEPKAGPSEPSSPPNNLIELVSVQTLGLQSVSSDFHQYFPITFDGHYAVCLDVMVHAMITGVHYNHPLEAFAKVLKINPLPPTPKDSLNSNSNDNSSSKGNKEESTHRPVSTLPASPVAKRMSTTIEAIPSKETDNGSFSFSGVFNRIARKASRILQKEDFTNSPANSPGNSQKYGSSQSEKPPVDPFDDSFVMESIQLERITEKKWKVILKELFSGLLANYQLAMTSSSFILKLYEEYQEENTMNAQLSSAESLHRMTLSDSKITDVYAEIKTILSREMGEELSYHNNSNNNSNRNNVEEKDAFTIHKPMNSVDILGSILKMLHKEIAAMNLHLSIQWSLIFTSCRKIMNSLIKLLSDQYKMEIEAFWKQQMIIHTRSLVGAERLVSKKDVITLSTLEEQMEIEKENDKRMLDLLARTNLFANNKSTSGKISENGSSRSGRNSTNQKERNLAYYPKILARGLKVFDVNVHMVKKNWFLCYSLIFFRFLFTH